MKKAISILMVFFILSSHSYAYYEETCSDGQRNQDESDTDCGGVCEGCRRAYMCNEDTDCESDLVCSFRRCTTKEIELKCGDSICEWGPESEMLCPLDCAHYERINPFKEDFIQKEANIEVIEKLEKEKEIKDDSFTGKIKNLFFKITGSDKIATKNITEIVEIKKLKTLEGIPKINWEGITYICDENLMQQVREIALKLGLKDGVSCGDSVDDYIDNDYTKCESYNKELASRARSSVHSIFPIIVTKSKEGILLKGQKYECNQELFYFIYDYNYYDGWREGFYSTIPQTDTFALDWWDFQRNYPLYDDEKVKEIVQITKTTTQIEQSIQEKKEEVEQFTINKQIELEENNDKVVEINEEKQAFTLSLQEIQSILDKSLMFQKISDKAVISISFDENGIINHKYDFTIRGKNVEKGIAKDYDVHVITRTYYLPQMKKARDICDVFKEIHSKWDMSVDRKISNLKAIYRYGNLIPDAKECLGVEISI